MKKRIYGAGRVLGKILYCILTEKKYLGLYNLVGKSETIQRKVAEELVKILGLDQNLAFYEVTPSYFRDTYFAPRPPSERLTNRKLELDNTNIMGEWKISLKEYINDYYTDYLEDSICSPKFSLVTI
ncbi:MAG: hypothetical protein ACRYFB_05150 [Janthinobacterium lividum]